MTLSRSASLARLTVSRRIQRALGFTRMSQNPLVGGPADSVAVAAFGGPPSGARSDLSLVSRAAGSAFALVAAGTGVLAQKPRMGQSRSPAPRTVATAPTTTLRRRVALHVIL